MSLLSSKVEWISRIEENRKVYCYKSNVLLLKCMNLTWARAGSTFLPVCSRNPAQSPSANTSSTEGTRSHWSTPILNHHQLSKLVVCQTLQMAENSEPEDLDVCNAPSTRALWKIKRFHKLRGTNASRPNQNSIRNFTSITENNLFFQDLFHSASHKMHTRLMQNVKMLDVNAYEKTWRVWEKHHDSDNLCQVFCCIVPQPHVKRR